MTPEDLAPWVQFLTNNGWSTAIALLACFFIWKYGKQLAEKHLVFLDKSSEATESNAKALTAMAAAMTALADHVVDCKATREALAAIARGAVEVSKTGDPKAGVSHFEQAVDTLRWPMMTAKN